MKSEVNFDGSCDSRDCSPRLSYTADEMAAVVAERDRMKSAINAVQVGSYLDDNVLNRHPFTNVSCDALRRLFECASDGEPCGAAPSEPSAEIIAERDRLRRFVVDVRDADSRMLVTEIAAQLRRIMRAFDAE